MTKRFAVVCVLGLSAFAAMPAGAETDPFGEVALLTGSIDKDVARREGIGSRGWGAMFGAGIKMQNVLVLGIEGSAQYISDKDSFTQNTTGGLYSSTTTLYDVAPYVGLRAPMGKDASLSVGANAGYSLVFGARTIDNCINCFSEDLSVDGGLYVEPVVTFGKSDGLQFGASFRLYLGGDVKNMIMVRVTKPF
jgi:hypothetical protein